jgi:hypothetical protein
MEKKENATTGRGHGISDLGIAIYVKKRLGQQMQQILLAAGGIVLGGICLMSSAQYLLPAPESFLHAQNNLERFVRQQVFWSKSFLPSSFD